jgi:hypothetical protein
MGGCFESIRNGLEPIQFPRWNPSDDERSYQPIQILPDSTMKSTEKSRQSSDPNRSIFIILRSRLKNHCVVKGFQLTSWIGVFPRQDFELPDSRTALPGFDRPDRMFRLRPCQNAKILPETKNANRQGPARSRTYLKNTTLKSYG